jgi:dihydroneopterin aldolase
MDQIVVHSLELFGRHGVHAEERALGQRFVVTLTVGLDTRPSARSDRIGDTVDYTRLIAVAREVVEGESCQLIETLAERIAARAGKLHPAVRSVTVEVKKPHPPVAANFGGVAVTITRQFPARRRPRA